MSVSLLECIEASGFDLNEESDARWFVSKLDEFEELMIKAEDLIEAKEDERNAKETAEIEAEAEQSDKEYQERMGGDE